MKPTTLLNGQPVPADVVDLATRDDGGVNTAVVAFLHPDYVRTGQQDTAIRAAPAREIHEADTLVTAPPTS